MEQVEDASDQLVAFDNFEMPMFRVFRKLDQTPASEVLELSRSFVSDLEDDLVSIKQILSKPFEFCADKVFQIQMG